MDPLDRHQRPLRNLRLSVTDRCNLRCRYCMPDDGYAWLPRQKVLRFEEMVRLVDVFVSAGVQKVRLTGGEPLLRRELEGLVAMLAERPGIRDLAMTTNGVLLRDNARALREAGLHRITVSLDSLDLRTFRLLSRSDHFDRVMDGIDAACEAGFSSVKLDTVVISGINDQEMPALLEFARAKGAELRFIEYMDVGGATQWSPTRVVTRREILDRLTLRFGPIAALPKADTAPADRFRLADGTTFGIVSSMSQPFCSTCDRARLTADGMWFTCLYALEGHDLGTLLRSGADDERLLAKVRATWSERTDRGAEERASSPDRRPLAARDHLRSTPHLEMHKRGG